MARGYRFGIFLVIFALLLSPAGALGAPAEQGGIAYYVVQPGDTLADIAYKLGVSASVLARANGIANWDLIYVGQALLIPGNNPAPTPEPPASPTPQAAATPAPTATPDAATTPDVVATSAASATPYAPATPDVAPPTAPAPTPVPGVAVVYTVVPGDTLAKLAARYGTSINAIMRANGLTNPDFIYVGQQLTIGGDATYAQPKGAPRSIPAEQAPASVPTQQPSRAVPQQQAPEASQGSKWIDVNLSAQVLTADEGDTPVLRVLISGGTADHPTALGEFSVNTKVRSQTMSGPGYNLPNVPWVMYFYRDYAIHGTYWHKNFGHPMSHGCVNVTIADAAWLYTWATIGTPVVTHW